MGGARIILLPKAMVDLSKGDGSFGLSFFTSCNRVFQRTYLQLSPPFFRCLGRGPYCALPRSTAENVGKLVSTASTVCVSCRGHFHGRVTHGRLRDFLLSVCSGACHCFAGDRVRNDGHRSRVFNGFVTVMRRRYYSRHSMAFCTGGLYVSAGCLAKVYQGMAKGSTGGVVSSFTVLRVGMLLRSSGLGVRRVTSGLKFPSRSCLNECFGQRRKVSPTRCQGKGRGWEIEWVTSVLGK